MYNVSESIFVLPIFRAILANFKMKLLMTEFFSPEENFFILFYFFLEYLSSKNITYIRTHTMQVNFIYML